RIHSLNARIVYGSRETAKWFPLSWGERAGASFSLTESFRIYGCGYARRSSLNPAFLYRLLLHQAMQRPETEDQIHCMNSHYRPVLENLAEHTERDTIVWIIECRDNYCRIRYVKIGVICWRS